MRRELTYPNLSEGRVAAYSAGEQGPGGLVLRDQVGANHGTLTGGATWESQSLNFDGTNDYVLIPSVFGLGIANVTISGWAKVASTSESGLFVVIGEDEAYPNRFGYGIGVGLNNADTNGNDLIGLFNNKRWIDTNAAVGIDWFHFALVLDSAGVPEIFLNGNSLGTFAGTNAGIPTTESYIGGYLTAWEGSTRNVNANLDDINIYSRALSPQEIATLAKRRGIAYEMDRRIVGAQAVAAAGLLPITQAYMRTRC